MSTFKYTAGLNNVGSYQVSGMPYATGSLDATTGDALKISFPYVTNWFYIINHDSTNHLTCSFSENGISTNFFRVQPDPSSDKGFSQTPVFHLKISELYFTGSDNFDVIAGLTNLPVQRITNASLSGSNWSGSVGVG